MLPQRGRPVLGETVLKESEPFEKMLLAYRR